MLRSDLIVRFRFCSSSKPKGVRGEIRVRPFFLPHPNEAIRKLYEEWKEHEPPTGEGWQLWETCSEGSPVSPVFASAEKLADWCAENATIFASEKTSRENWLKMFIGEKDLETGSLLVVGGGFIGALANAPSNP